MLATHFIFSFLLFFVISGTSGKTCSVLDYGGKADNKTDVGPAILKAYSDCVKNSTGNILQVPSGLFLLDSNVLLGGSDYTFQLDGTITIAFNTKLGGTMLQWNDCNNIVVSGNGKVLGQGSFWRPNNDLSKYPGRPRLFRFQNCNNCKISGITLVNSPMFHITVIGNNNELSHIVIDADVIGETDGFDMSGNGNYVHDVQVTNGDECVTVKTPTDGFRAENIICHNTAGCNIGSFGNGANTAAVQNVYYKNVTMYNSDAGAQIKTYPNNLGQVKNITYEDFTLSSIAYPIAIDLFWCPGTTCPSASGNLAISDVQFINFKGTQATNKRPVVLLDCLANSKCKDIVFKSVSLTALDGPTHDSISNACGSGRSSVPSC